MKSRRSFITSLFAGVASLATFGKLSAKETPRILPAEAPDYRALGLPLPDYWQVRFQVVTPTGPVDDRSISMYNQYLREGRTDVFVTGARRALDNAGYARDVAFYPSFFDEKDKLILIHHFNCNQDFQPHSLGKRILHEGMMAAHGRHVCLIRLRVE